MTPFYAGFVPPLRAVFSIFTMEIDISTMESHLPLAVSEPANGVAVLSSPRRLQCKLNEPQRSKNDEERSCSSSTNFIMAEADFPALPKLEKRDSATSSGNDLSGRSEQCPSRWQVHHCS